MGKVKNHFHQASIEAEGDRREAGRTDRREKNAFPGPKCPMRRNPPADRRGQSELEKPDLEQLFNWGLYIKGDHHRLWCLHQVALLLIEKGMLPADILDADMDEGIAPQLSIKLSGICERLRQWEGEYLTDDAHGTIGAGAERG